MDIVDKCTELRIIPENKLQLATTFSVFSYLKKKKTSSDRNRTLFNHRKRVAVSCITSRWRQ